MAAGGAEGEGFRPRRRIRAREEREARTDQFILPKEGAHSTGEFWKLELCAAKPDLRSRRLGMKGHADSFPALQFFNAG